jgi:hypothetical protein
MTAPIAPHNRIASYYGQPAGMPVANPPAPQTNLSDRRFQNLEQSAVHALKQNNELKQQMMEMQQVLAQMTMLQIAKENEPKRGSIGKVWDGVKNALPMFGLSLALAAGAVGILYGKTNLKQLYAEAAESGLLRSDNALAVGKAIASEAATQLKGAWSYAVKGLAALSGVTGFLSTANFYQGYAVKNPK